jgi:hypothetical protein
MKIVRFQTGNTIKYGILEGEAIIAIDGEPWGRRSTPSSMRYNRKAVKLLARRASPPRSWRSV